MDYDELDATDGSRGLLGTNRDENPNGLNPSPDEALIPEMVQSAGL